MPLKLKKHPQTEMEYWKIIRILLHRKDKKSQEIVKSLTLELETKFGVIPPDKCPLSNFGKRPPAPGIKIYFDDWFQEMEIKFQKCTMLISN
jgi:hypothetical protein